MRGIVYVVTEAYSDNTVGVYRSLETAKNAVRSLLWEVTMEYVVEPDGQYFIRGYGKKHTSALIDFFRIDKMSLMD